MASCAMVTQRQAVAIDPHLQVLIVHGWNDLSCRSMGSILTVDQMPTMGSNPDGAGAQLSGRAHVLQPGRQSGGVPE